MLKHSPVVLIAILIFVASGLSQAKPQDLAPIPDEVIQRLHARLATSDLPLVQETNLHRQEILNLIGQLKTLKQTSNQDTNKTELKAALKTAIQAKAYELRVLNESLQTNSDLANKSQSIDAQMNVDTKRNQARLEKRLSRDKTLNIKPIQKRLTQLANALEAVAAGDASPKRLESIERMIQAPSPQQDFTVTPNKGFSIENAKPEPAQTPSTEYPAYAMQSISTPVILATADGSETLAAVLPTLPEPTSCGWVAADIANDGRNVLINQEIRDLAKQLDYSPVKIMEWVNKEIAFEPYYGALKGSQGVLYTKAGGPTDIASLTIALLRASNIPARYVTGQISVTDKSTNEPADSGKAQQWLGTKTHIAATQQLTDGRFPGARTIRNSTTNLTIAVEFKQVWVEACVPYAYYRGSQLGSGGERWVPLDPSFRQRNYQPGVSLGSLDLNYATYLAKRSNELPAEFYEKQIKTYLATLSPRRTIDDVPYSAKPNTLRFDILPASLPYTLVNFVNWSNSGRPDTAILPDSHQYRYSITPRNTAGTALSATFNAYLPDVALKRVTLGFKGANPTAQQSLQNWQRDNQESTAPPCPLSVIPSIKVDGVERSAGTTAVDFCSEANKLDMAILVDELSVPEINKVSYSNIQAANLHALQAYAFQGSDRLLTERVAKLLNSVRSNANPNNNSDDIEGEFLHIVGLKFMHYMTLDDLRLGQLAGESGRSGMHLGLTSTQAKIQYAFDMPLGVNRKGFLVDVPGGVSRSKNLMTGNSSLASFMRSSYNGSSLESYVWQENARLDAVSTVRGLQFAAENNISVLNLTSANWAANKSLFTTNTNGALNYSLAEINNIETNYINQGFKLKIPRSRIQYDDWLGSVYVAEKDDGAGTIRALMAIAGGYNGGYTLNRPVPVTYSPTLNTGYAFISPPPPVYNFSTPVTPPPTTISSAIGLGATAFSVFAGDPVNLVNGNLYHNERDIAIKGRGGFPIVFERAYNSREAKDGSLGFGWTHSFNHYLLFSSDNPDGVTAADDTDNIVSSIVWVDGTGSRKMIRTNSTATAFTTPTGFYFTVSREAGTNRFVITEKSGLKYTFENQAATVPANEAAAQAGRAKLVSITDRNGNALNLAYTGSNLSTVTDSLNRALNFTHTNNRITQISDWTGRRWQYGYNSNNDLVSFKNPLAVAGNQAAVTYNYYGALDGQNLNHAMKDHILPRGNGMHFDYYVNGRVFRHYPIDRLDEVTSFSYNDFRRETVVTEPNGHTQRHFFDRFGNPEQTLTDHGALTSYTYDCRSTTDCPNPYLRLSETDAIGNTINYAYDTAGNLIRTSIAASNTELRRFDFAANTFGQPRRIQDARGNWSILRYDAKGNVTDSIALKAGSTVAACTGECAIPAAANILSWTQRTYDVFGNVTQLKRIRDFNTQAGPTLTTNFNDSTNAVIGLNAVQFTRTGDKNGDGSLDSPDIANQSFDSLGRVKQAINDNWYTTTVNSYDALDRPITQTDAIGRQIDNTFDANGNLIITRISKNGKVLDISTTTYDNADRAINTIDNAGQQTAFTYDAQGNLKTTINPDGYKIEAGYDLENRLTEASDSEGLLTVRDYDVGGRLQRITNPAGITQTYTYFGPEQNGRLKRSELPAIQGATIGRAIEQDYDVNGNIIKRREVGSNNSVREHSYYFDALNRLSREISPIIDPTVSATARRQICRVYNNLGNLTELWIGSTTETPTVSSSASCNFADTNLKKQITYVYDDFGRKLRETDGLNRSWHWTYDIYNNISTQRDAKNQTTNYTYKTGGLPNTRLDHAGRTTTYTHNDLGQLNSVGDNIVTFTYGYDDAHRTNRVTDSRGNKTLRYGYSAGGLLNRMVDSDNRYTDYIYDGVGRLIGQWLPNDAFFGWAYNSRGLLEVKWSDVDVTSTYDWNADGSLQRLTHKTDASTNLNGNIRSQHTYTYDAFGTQSVDDYVVASSSGNIANRSRTTRNNLGQINAWYNQATLPSAGAETLVESYQYDAFGNRSRLTQAATGNYYRYNLDAAQQLNQIQQFNSSNTLIDTVNLQYDTNGSLTSKQSPQGTLTLTWDAMNRLASATSNITQTGTGSQASTQAYTYDAFDRRISKTISAGAGASTTPVTHYLYDGDNIHAEYANWAQPINITSYTGTDNAIGRFSLPTNATATTAFSSANYLHSNAQGNTDVITQHTTTGLDIITGAAVRDPFGKLSTVNANVSPAINNQSPALQGRSKDETGLHNFRARYLDVNAVQSISTNRFISRDPLGYEGGINPYVAFENDPLTYSDPSGTTSFGSLSGSSNNNYFAGATATAGTYGGRVIGGGLSEVFAASRLIGGVLLAPLAIPGDTAQNQRSQEVYLTYTRTNPTSGQVYSGRTSGSINESTDAILNRRMAGQPILNAQGYDAPQVDKSSSNYSAIRGREQQLIDFNGGAQSVGGSARNMINGVADGNPNRPFYMGQSNIEFGGPLPDNSPNRPRLGTDLLPYLFKLLGL